MTFPQSAALLFEPVIETADRKLFNLCVCVRVCVIEFQVVGDTEEGGGGGVGGEEGLLSSCPHQLLWEGKVVIVLRLML